MRFFMITLGCPKNSVDSEMMAELLRQAGHARVENPRRADVLLVNTCGFIEPARAESYDVLKELAATKRRGQWLVAAGCMAQRYGDALRQPADEPHALYPAAHGWQSGSVRRPAGRDGRFGLP